MRAPRLAIVAAGLVAIGSSPAWAQTQAPAHDHDAAGKAAPVAMKTPEGVFVVKPYIQLGHAPAPGTIQLLWQAADTDADWSVEYRAGVGRRWQKAENPTARRVAVAGIEPHRIYRAALAGLEPDGVFSYRVARGGEAVFAADARALKSAKVPHRFVVFGDCGAGTPEQRPIALRAYESKPDFLMITGDIVYARGRISEYRQNFWPIYNADTPGSAGVPLLRSTLFTAAPGNHDTATRDLGRYPDGLAYFFNWDQPLNGPEIKEGGPLALAATGPEANRKAFVEAAGDAYPRMANFSFDYGNAHWTVLDANPYVDWSDRDLQAWVARDLASAKGATWRFVSFHHPGFNSAREHFEQQQARLMAPVFEAGKVDVVFNGHVHNYQRSYPLRFVPATGKVDAPGIGKGGRPARGGFVSGKWTLDRRFDGRTDTTPEGVIYLVTGAGGQHLYNPEQQDDPGSWQEFTHKFVSKVHTLTIADVDGPSLTIRQVTAHGEEVDRFVVTK